MNYLVTSNVSLQQDCKHTQHRFKEGDEGLCAEECHATCTARIIQAYIYNIDIMGFMHRQARVSRYSLILPCFVIGLLLYFDV